MINWEEIAKVNKEIGGGIDFKGKEYIEVNKRVLAFRKICPQGTISTEIVSIGDGVVVMKATILDDKGQVLATGFAYEKEQSSFINKTSYIENCETSCVGRALGFVGLGIDATICSAEELCNAVLQQEDMKKQQPKVDINKLIVEQPIQDKGQTKVQIKNPLFRKANHTKDSICDELDDDNIAVDMLLARLPKEQFNQINEIELNIVNWAKNKGKRVCDLTIKDVKNAIIDKKLALSKVNNEQ